MRPVSPQFDAALDVPRSRAALLYFVTMSHPEWSETVTIVSNGRADNVRDHMLGNRSYGGVLLEAGETRYYGIPFRLQILSDDDRPPRGHLAVLNVDRRLGAAVELISSGPLITIEQFAAADFTRALDPDAKARLPLATPSVEYRASYLTLTGVSGGPLWIEGDLASYGLDLSRAPICQVCATADRLPGLQPW